MNRFMHRMYSYDAKTPCENVQKIRLYTLKKIADKQYAGAHCNVGSLKLAPDSVIKWVECCVG